MGAKGSYSYSPMSCFSYTARFSNPLFCIAHLLYDSGALPTEKSNYSLDLATVKRGEKEYDAHCMTGINSSAPLFLMYKPTVVHSPEVLLILLATLALKDQSSCCVQTDSCKRTHTSFLAIISLSHTDTHKQPCILLQGSCNSVCPTGALSFVLQQFPCCMCGDAKISLHFFTFMRGKNTLQH